MERPIQVLLTGAATVIGRAILKTLLEHSEDYSITAFDKKSKTSRTVLEFFKDEINIIYGDISNPEDTLPISAGKDFVIHCAYLDPKITQESPTLAQKNNVFGTRYLVENLEYNSPNCYFTTISNVSVYGDRLTSPQIKVGDLTAPSIEDYHSLTLLQAEHFIQNSSLSWTIFRSGFVLDADNFTPNKDLFKIPLNSLLEFIHVEDLSFAVVNSYYHKEELSEQVFNLGGGENCILEYHEFVNRLMQTIGWGEILFPEGTFAKYNGYGGVFADEDKLSEIIDYQKYTIDDFFSALKKSKTFINQISTKLFGGIQKKSFINMSEPYKAYKDPEKSKFYF